MTMIESDSGGSRFCGGLSCCRTKTRCGARGDMCCGDARLREWVAVWVWAVAHVFWCATIRGAKRENKRSLAFNVMCDGEGGWGTDGGTRFCVR